MTATDLAGYLARKAVPFRGASDGAGRVVRRAVETGRTLSEMTVDELRAFSSTIESGVSEAPTLEGLGAARGHPGAAQVVAPAKTSLRTPRNPRGRC